MTDNAASQPLAPTARRIADALRHDILAGVLHREHAFVRKITPPILAPAAFLSGKRSRPCRAKAC